jgi:hypothetical protein
MTVSSAKHHDNNLEISFNITPNHFLAISQEVIVITVTVITYMDTLKLSA